MAYDEFLAERILNILNKKRITFSVKKMMGGLTYMVDGKMCIGVVKNNMMARIGPKAYDEALKQTGCKEMSFTGRPIKGYVFIEPEGVDMEKDLEYWIQLCLDFNPLAKASKKN